MFLEMELTDPLQMGTLHLFSKPAPAFYITYPNSIKHKTINISFRKVLRKSCREVGRPIKEIAPVC